MSIVFDGLNKTIISHANTPLYIGNYQYAIDPILPYGVAYKYLKVIPGSITFKSHVIATGIVQEMDAGEKAAVDAAELAAAKPARKVWLKARGDAYTDERYSSDTQEKLQALYSDSLRHKPKRGVYLQPWINWLDKVNEEVKVKQTLVDTKTTATDVNAVVLDEATLTSQDPGVTIDGANNVVDDPTVGTFVDSNAIVTDPETGVQGPFNLMQTLEHRKDLYNDTQNPIYKAGHTPILGAGGWAVDHANRISNIETIHGKLGWHNQQVMAAIYSRPRDMLIYYGWLNSFNSATNGWVNEKVAQEMSQYSILVFGDGVQDPAHGDYANTTVIIPRIKALNPNALIFGYVDTTLAIGTFQTKVDQWNTLGVHGILMDKSGYDFGTHRDAFNTRVDYIHGKTSANLVFANCWNPDHILGTNNDVSFPNATFNPTLVASKLTVSDWILLESWPINTDAYVTAGQLGYEPKADWAARGVKMIGLRAAFGVNFAAGGIILDAHAQGAALFNFLFTSALMFSLDAVGSSDTSYGASSAKGKRWARPDVNGLGVVWTLSPAVQVDTGDVDVYIRQVEAAKFLVDFSASAQLSSITKR